MRVKYDYILGRTRLKDSGSGGGVGPKLKASNYTELSATAGENINDLAYVLNAQGTPWLPGTIGGNYYPAGWYSWNGTEWVSDRNDISEKLDEIT